MRRVNRQVALTISASRGTTYNIFTQASSPTDAVDVVLTINSGVVISGVPGTVALDTGTGWASGSTICVINNGDIRGEGGFGGNGGAPGSNGSDGGAGDHAIKLQWPLTIDNTNGSVLGGGGGGGGGGGSSAGGTANGGGGGAGGGASNSSGGSSAGNPGLNNTGPTGALGGAGQIDVGFPNAGKGGQGGDSGSAGNAGDGNANGSRFGGAGGVPGKAVQLNGNGIAWLGGNNGTQVKGAVA